MTLEDYKNKYKRKTKSLVKKGLILSCAKAKAWDETFKAFKQKETPCDELIKEFRKFVK